MYTILASAIPEESRVVMEDAFENVARLKFCSGDETLFDELKEREYDLLFLYSKEAEEGLRLLHEIHDNMVNTQIILIGEVDKAEYVVDVLTSGASDYLLRPLSVPRVKMAVHRAMENRDLRNEIDYLRHKQDIVYRFGDVIAHSQNMKNVLISLEKFSKTDSTILITGATGTGKSFLSGTVHYNSPRKQKPFIKINCANIPEDLLESELFGHEKGAFTGADKQRIGRFEQAGGGTLFLDEIGEISLSLQSKLLRVLEEKSFERVGGNKTIYSDVRVIAATNKNLSEQISKGKFREDLFYRINVLPIRLPDLKDRKKCIEPLAGYFLKKYAKTMGSNVAGFTEDSLQQIQAYNWPGNIRQLANTIERAVILEDGELLSKQNLSLPHSYQKATSAGGSVVAHSGSVSLVGQEKELIMMALEECLWVQKNAADLLGISPRSLNYKVKKFGITHPHWRKHK